VDVSDLGTALSNPTRVNLLRLLGDSSYDASEAHKAYNQTFEETKHRESIYRELEKLVDSGLVRKDYDQEEKQLVYSLQYTSVEVDLRSGNIDMREYIDN